MNFDFPVPSAVWDDALQQAAGSFPALSGGGLLFLEERQDLVLEATARAGILQVDQWKTCGLAVQGPFDTSPTLSMANPSPDDAGHLAQAAASSRGLDTPHGERGGFAGCSLRPGVATRAPAAHQPTEAQWLPLRGACQLLEGLVSEAEKLQRAACIRAHWVGFEQRIRVARAHHELVKDRRQCHRVRLEMRRAGATGEVVAAGDALLVPGSSCRQDDLHWLARVVASRLDERRHVRAAPSGDRRIVFAPGIGGMLIHELVGHALEGDVVAAGASWLARLGPGERCGPAELTVLDDPRRGRAAWRVDDEGTSVRPVPLVRGGRVAGWMHDLQSAAHTGRTPTGHGRRSSYHEPVRPRMGCTFIAAGRFHPDEVMDGVDEGIYVRRMENASTDTGAGRAVFWVTDADRVQHGRLGAPLKPHLLVVDRRALSSIERVSFDVAFDTCVGSCLRDGQPMSTSVGGPTFRIGLSGVIA